MKTFQITMPIAGYITRTIEAITEDEAVQIFHDTLDIKSEGDFEEFIWETHKEIVSGNIFHGEINTMEIQEIDMGEDD